MSAGDRFFTLSEAREALPQVRALAERLVSAHQLVQAFARERLRPRPRPDSPVPGAYLRGLMALAGTEERLSEIGVMVKDHARGLLDFPALYGGRVVLLCWRVGEPDIEWWHEPEAGFSGRRPVSELPPPTQVD